MQVIPAIDILDGKCVRLEKGAFASATRYYRDPRDAARWFADAGADRLHIVDLDGARTGTPTATAIIRDICRDTGFKVQTGGGLRDETAVARLLDNAEVIAVIGSLAICDGDALQRIVARHGADRIIVAADVQITDSGAKIAIQGWQQNAGVNLDETLQDIADLGVRTILVTDIDRDGMLSGPNVDLYARLVRNYPSLAVQASGGVGEQADLARLAEASPAAVIVGKAFYEGRIKPQGLWDAG